MSKLLSPLSVLLVAFLTVSSAAAQGLTADVAAGEKKIAMCLGCHGIEGYRSSFPEIYRVPMISGQGAGYIVSALTAYKAGHRKHPTMRGIAIGLSEQDIVDLSAYYEASGKAPGARVRASVADDSAPAIELVRRGACVACHGVTFNKPLDPSYPKLAGQHADYLFAALKAYKTNTNSSWGRDNPVMAGVVQQFSNAELKELAEYVSSLPTELRTTPQSGFK